MQNTEQKGRTLNHFFPCLKIKVCILTASLKHFENKSGFNTTEEEWHQEQMDIWARIKDRMETCKCGGHADGVD